MTDSSSTEPSVEPAVESPSEETPEPSAHLDPHAEGGEEEESQKKVSKKEGLSFLKGFLSGAKGFIGAFQTYGLTPSSFKQVLGSIKSPDRATRKMSRIYFLSAACLLCVLGIGAFSVWKKRQAEKRELARQLAERIQSQTHKTDFGVEFALGQFLLEVNPERDGSSRGQDVQLAQIDITVICDTIETCHYVRDHLVPARDQVTELLIDIERKELLSTKGKHKLNSALLHHLNEWLPTGKIKSLFFTNIMID